MTPDSTAPLASGSVTVRADAADVYALLTDLDRLADLADETHSMRWVGSSGARPGASFVGRNRNGLHRWSTTCTVTVADPGSAFAFDVHYGPFSLPIAHWRYDIDSGGDGGETTVTERMWDRRPRWFVGVGGLATGVRDRATVNGDHIAATLERLRQTVDGPADS
jgi:hypothetical protein